MNEISRSKVDAPGSLKCYNRLMLNFALVFAILLPSNKVAANFFVSDFDGNAISNARVRIETRKERISFWGTRPESFVTTEGRTDADGHATVNFVCHSGRFFNYTTAEGYYSDSCEGRVENKEGPINAFYLTMLEKEKAITTRLKPKKKPIPMFAKSNENIMTIPESSEAIGYDLKIGSWVTPFGCGEVADFYVGYQCSQSNNFLVRNGYVEFRDPQCGAYKLKNDQCKAMPTVYEANTNAVYASRLEYVSVCDEFKRVCFRSPIVDEDEYLVLRTRVRVDSDGHILQANYSKIGGRFFIEGGCFGIGNSYFNPTPNDPNLEYNGENLLPKEYRQGY